MDVQNATKKDVLDFEEMDKCLNEKIYENSKRNIFKMENKISYQNYRQIQTSHIIPHENSLSHIPRI